MTVRVRIDQHKPNITLSLTNILKLHTRIKHVVYTLASHRGLYINSPLASCQNVLARGR